MPPQHEQQPSSSDGATVATMQLSESDDDDASLSSCSDLDDRTSLGAGRRAWPRRAVSFDRRVRIREHGLVLGDHPLSPVLPLALDWASAPDRLAALDAARHSRRGRYRVPRRLSGAARRLRLYEVNADYDDARRRTEVDNIVQNAWEAAYTSRDDPMDDDAGAIPASPSAADATFWSEPTVLRRSASCRDVPRFFRGTEVHPTTAAAPSDDKVLRPKVLDGSWLLRSTWNIGLA